MGPRELHVLYIPLTLIPAPVPYCQKAISVRGIDGRDETMRTSDLLGGRIKMGKGKMNEKGKKIEKDFIYFLLLLYIYIYIYSFSPFEALGSSLFILLF
jgi:hypothetical protein